jgi:hypothetical protein
MLREGATPVPDLVAACLAAPTLAPASALTPFTPTLDAYDALLEPQVQEVAS